MSDGLIRLPSARRLEIRIDGAGGKITGTVSPGREREPALALIGKLDRGGPIEELLGTHGRSDEELIRAAYQRFGWGGFLRLSGPFAAAIAEAELVLSRSPTFGAERAIYVRELQDNLQFSTELSDLRGDLDANAVRSWLEHRVWAPRSTTPFGGVSQVEAGGVLIAGREGTKRDRFWTFTPFGIPRQLSVEEARRELEEAIGAVLARAPEDAEVLAESPALELFRSKLVRSTPIERRRDFDPDALARAYRAIGWPAALSEAAEIAALLGSDRPLVIDLGMRQVMGATETGLGAYVESISAQFAASPSPSVLLGVVKTAAPIDRRLARSRLLPSLANGARFVGHRWKRHLPPTLAHRLAIQPPAMSIVDPVTGDRFTDQRFAETLDPGLAARHRALVSARPVIAPFLDPRVVELLFSLPKPHFVDGDRIMKIVRGGVPLHPIPEAKLPSYPDDHPYRDLPRRWFYDLERDTDDDRWLGLGAFLSVWSV